MEGRENAADFNKTAPKGEKVGGRQSDEGGEEMSEFGSVSQKEKAPGVKRENGKSRLFIAGDQPLALFLGGTVDIDLFVTGELAGKRLTESGVDCPHCGKKNSNSIARLFAGQWISCSCGRRFNWRTGTIYEGSKLSPAAVFCLHLGFSLNLPTSTVAAWTGLSESAVRAWRAKLRTLDEIDRAQGKLVQEENRG